MPRGRPKSTDKKSKPSHIRVHADIAAMMGEVTRQTGVTALQFAEQYLRLELSKRLLELLPGLERMAKTSEEVRERLEALAPVIARAKATVKGEPAED